MWGRFYYPVAKRVQCGWNVSLGYAVAYRRNPRGGEVAVEVLEMARRGGRFVGWCERSWLRSPVSASDRPPRYISVLPSFFKIAIWAARRLDLRLRRHRLILSEQVRMILLYLQFFSPILRVRRRGILDLEGKVFQTLDRDRQQTPSRNPRTRTWIWEWIRPRCHSRSSKREAQAFDEFEALPIGEAGLPQFTVQITGDWRSIADESSGHHHSLLLRRQRHKGDLFLQQRRPGARDSRRRVSRKRPWFPLLVLPHHRQEDLRLLNGGRLHLLCDHRSERGEFGRPYAPGEHKGSLQEGSPERPPWWLGFSHQAFSLLARICTSFFVSDPR